MPQNVIRKNIKRWLLTDEDVTAAIARTKILEKTVPHRKADAQEKKGAAVMRAEVATGAEMTEEVAQVAETVTAGMAEMTIAGDAVRSAETAEREMRSL